MVIAVILNVMGLDNNVYAEPNLEHCTIHSYTRRNAFLLLSNKSIEGSFPGQSQNIEHVILFNIDIHSKNTYIKNSQYTSVSFAVDTD